MSTTTGQKAETAAACYLEQLGFKIIHRNWRRRSCEIDIIASHRSRRGLRLYTTIYCVEVKFRRTIQQGDGLDYITSIKRKQMKYALEVWRHYSGWTGDCRLLAIAVSGDDNFIASVCEVLPD